MKAGAQKKTAQQRASHKWYMANRELCIARTAINKKRRLKENPEAERRKRRNFKKKWEQTTAAGRESRRRAKRRRMKRFQDALAIIQKLGIKL